MNSNELDGVIENFKHMAEIRFILNHPGLDPDLPLPLPSLEEELRGSRNEYENLLNDLQGNVEQMAALGLKLQEAFVELNSHEYTEISPESLKDNYFLHILISAMENFRRRESAVLDEDFKSTIKNGMRYLKQASINGGDRAPAGVRLDAFETLVQLDVTNAIEVSGRIIRNNDEPYLVMRERAIHVISRLAEQEAQQGLIAVTIEESINPWSLRIYSAELLIENNPEKAIKEISKLIKVESEEKGFRLELLNLTRKAPVEIRLPALLDVFRATGGDIDTIEGDIDLLFACADTIGDSKGANLLNEVGPFLVDDNIYKRLCAVDIFKKLDVSWQEKADGLLNYFKQANVSRDRVYVQQCMEAIKPLPGEVGKTVDDINLVTNHLIAQAEQHHADKKMTANLAKLIVHSAKDDTEHAGRLINEYQKKKNVKRGNLRNLLVGIGGETALMSVTQTLQKNLEQHFQEPINELNRETHTMWLKTITDARYGFMARITMSVILFLVGIVLLLAASYEMIFGDLEQGQFFGPGVSFVTGLGTMLLIVYTGPLKEIRLSVNDLGIASAAFIAYIHRVLEISHTFSYYYLQQKITFEEMKQSSDLIDEAMTSTVKALLSNKSRKGSEAIIKELIASRNKVEESE